MHPVWPRLPVCIDPAVCPCFNSVYRCCSLNAELKIQLLYFWNVSSSFLFKVRISLKSWDLPMYLYFEIYQNTIGCDDEAAYVLNSHRFCSLCDRRRLKSTGECRLKARCTACGQLVLGCYWTWYSWGVFLFYLLEIWLWAGEVLSKNLTLVT